MAVTSNISYTLCFDSTLYTKPILDLLLANVPSKWHFDLRLGLQEALINAVKHGNKLDKSRKVTIEFFMVSASYHWIVKDQGENVKLLPNHHTFCCEAECGRGIYIMHQIFDYVHWNQHERKLHLFKQMESENLTNSPNISSFNSLVTPSMAIAR